MSKVNANAPAVKAADTHSHDGDAIGHAITEKLDNAHTSNPAYCVEESKPASVSRAPRGLQVSGWVAHWLREICDGGAPALPPLQLSDFPHLACFAGSASGARLTAAALELEVDTDSFEQLCLDLYAVDAG